MSEERRCQLKALLNEEWGRAKRARPKPKAVGLSPKRKPRRANVEAFTTENAFREQFSMKKMKQDAPNVKQAEPTLYGANLSALTDDDHNEIRHIILKAMVRAMFSDLQPAAKPPKVRRGFRVIDGGLCV